MRAVALAQKPSVRRHEGWLAVDGRRSAPVAWPTLYITSTRSIGVDIVPAQDVASGEYSGAPCVKG